MYSLLTAPQVETAVRFFIFAFVELSVLFVGISLIVELIREFLPPERIKNMLSGSRPSGYFFAAVTGALTPFCSCSTIPMTTGFLRAGGGFGPVMTFLFVSPLLNPVLATLFIVNFGLYNAVLYGGIAITTAIFFGIMLQQLRFNRYLLGEKSVSRVSFADIQPVEELTENNMAEGEGCCSFTSGNRVKNDNRVPDRRPKWRHLLTKAVGEYREFLPYVIIGVAVGAVAHGFVPDGLLAEYAGDNNWFAVPVAAFIGIPLYVRASTMIPISMSLLGKGMSIGAVMALVIGGAGASLPEMIMLKKLFRWPLLCVFFIEVFFMAVGAGTLFNLIS